MWVSDFADRAHFCSDQGHEFAVYRLSSGFGILLLVIALLAILIVGVRYGFKIIERSSKGFLRPSDYPLTNDDLVSEYLPYKYAAINLVLAVLVKLLEVISGGTSTTFRSRSSR